MLHMLVFCDISPSRLPLSDVILLKISAEAHVEIEGNNDQLPNFLVNDMNNL